MSCRGFCSFSTASSTMRNPWMYPSSWRIRAISALSLLAGRSTRACLADTALRMRVSMSEIGSVISCSLLSKPKSQIPNPKSQIPTESRPVGVGDSGSGLWDLPRALRHARHVAFERQLPEAQAAHRELAHVGARPPAQPAPVAEADLVLGRLGFL